MEIGFLTTPFAGKKSLTEVARWAAGAGFQKLEITCGPHGHIDAEKAIADNGEEIRQILKQSKMAVSSLAYYPYFQWDKGAADFDRVLRQLIAAAEAVGAPCVCTFAGFPASGKTKMQTIREELPRFFEPLAAEAQKRGVKIAFENWFSTNLQHLDHFQALCEALPYENVGFNFDPSHLSWQEIDVLAAVREFAGRIFHTHAKDAAVFMARKSRIGVLENGWWEYVIPGYGVLEWGKYIRQLRQCGYNGVLSIEHEDPAFSAEEGLEKGMKFLSSLA